MKFPLLYICFSKSTAYNTFQFKKMFWIWCKVLDTILLWQDVGPCCEQTHATFEVGLSLDHRQGVYSGWPDVVVSSQLRLCHTCIIDVMSALQIRSALGYTPFAKQMPSFAKHSPCFALPCVSTANQFLSRSKNMVSHIKIVCCALRIRSALEYISTAIETSSFAKQKHSSVKHSPSFAPQYFLSRNN